MTPMSDGPKNPTPPQDLFGMGVRLVGLVGVLLGMPALFRLDLVGAAPCVAGLILITRADLIVKLCYPTSALKAQWREKFPPQDEPPKDFTDL
jgi:hypothetical protein